MKTCQCCGKPLIRKRFPGGRLESNSAFKKRLFCSLICANTRRPETQELRRQQAATGATAEPQTTKQATTVEPQTTKKTALQILEEAANNTSLDWNSRITAAKALAPFQSRRIGEAQGKKAERQEGREAGSSW